MKTPAEILEEQAGGVLTKEQLAGCRDELRALTDRLEKEHLSPRSVFGLNTDKFIKEMVLSRVMPGWLLRLCTVAVQFAYILGGITLLRALGGLAAGREHPFSDAYPYHWLFLPVLVYAVMSALHPMLMTKSLSKEHPRYAGHYRLIRILLLLFVSLAGFLGTRLLDTPAVSFRLLLFLYIYIAGILAYGILNTLAQNHFFLCMRIGLYQIHPKHGKEEVYLLANQLYEQSYDSFNHSGNPNKHNEAYFRIMKRDKLRTSRVFVFAGFFLALLLALVCLYITFTSGISIGGVALLLLSIGVGFLFLLGILYEKVMFVTLASLDAIE